MGCINTPKIIKVYSKESSEKDNIKKIQNKEYEKSLNDDFTFFDEEINDTPHRIIKKLQIPTNSKMEDNELSFL